MKTFFLGMKNELLIVKETGNGYEVSSYLKGTHPSRLAFDPHNKKCIYCSTNGDGLFKSEDGGRDWKKIGGDAIHSSVVSAVAVDENSIVYAGTEPSHLYYSEDKGETWKEFHDIQALPSKENWSFPPRPETHFVRWITPDFANPGNVGVAIEAGAFIRTEDGGKIWIDRPGDSPQDTHTLLAHRDAPGRLYSASGDRAYAESMDNGESWKYMNEGLGNLTYLYHMVINPKNPNDRLVSASKSARDAHGGNYSSVFRKIGDEAWEETADGLPKKDTYTQVLAADPVEEDIFYALTNHGIFQLKPGAESWTKFDMEWNHDYLQQQPACFAVEHY